MAAGRRRRWVSTRRFYDDLAETYHALYPDWRGESGVQGEALHALLSRWHDGSMDVADVACGIGTQLIGLAERGHRVIGTDISARAVQRAVRECAAAHVPATVAVADMRALPLPDACVDAVVCADNALPHLVDEGDALAALVEATRVLRPGGTVVVTTRDYDRQVVERPTSTVPQVFDSGGERIVSFQLWHWQESMDVYDVEHFQVHERDDDALTAECRRVTYRAYTRGALTALARRAGLEAVAWHLPEETGFFQPLMTANRPVADR